ncbi:carbohydrate ABC transporter permease [Inconstantimicrobium mannanitabidum]|uniref:Sugar ABC transporter permease n=1 Tax=Inconstantimicrobium mannanitabidum TaxID=1604901 RepID=A0ACB5R7L5_9CLOT|nr:carbohydrate ABC transporter permease [Clostridium sp. TW13]GKX65031.1 sugar ABC transporter permease [Clostridium sp. TW13]
MEGNVQVNNEKKTGYDLNKSSKMGRMFWSAFKYFTLIIASLIFIIPVLVVFFGAFKTKAEFYGTASKLTLPHSFLNFENFRKAFVDGGMLTGFVNTVVIMLGSLLFVIMFGSMVAYVIQRFDFKGKKLVFGLYMTAMLIPMVTTQICTYKIMSNLDMFVRTAFNSETGIINTPISVIILYIGADVMSIIIMMQFLDSISVSLDESAMLDGASYFYIFFRIILPLLKPAIATVLIIKGVGIYNDFYTQYLYLPSKEARPISTSLLSFMGPYGGEWNVICAGIIIIMIPTTVLFLCLQKYIYNGFAAGAVKG